MADASHMSARLALRDSKSRYRFEIFVGRGFCDYESAAIAETLNCANDILAEPLFEWRFVSETPGIVKSKCGLLVRADPVVPDHDLSDVLIVVGGGSGKDEAWLPRLRQMRRMSLDIVLLSDAATTYIRRAKPSSGKVTTHWHDAVGLNEIDDYPNLTNTLFEKSEGVITAAGSGATKELVIELIAPLLNAADYAELGNRLMLQVVRTAQAEQPRDIKSVPALSDARLKLAVDVMERSIDAPLNIYELAEKVDISTRHLERMFKESLGQTPARFYKQLRTKRARTLVEETQMPLVEVAIATGFGSHSSMSEALKQKYGLTAKKLRDTHKSKS